MHIARECQTLAMIGGLPLATNTGHQPLLTACTNQNTSVIRSEDKQQLLGFAVPKRTQTTMNLTI